MIWAIQFINISKSLEEPDDSIILSPLKLVRH